MRVVNQVNKLKNKTKIPTVDDRFIMPNLPRAKATHFLILILLLTLETSNSILCFSSFRQKETTTANKQTPR